MADPTTEETPPVPDDLGDAGKKALDAERKARREAEARLKELEPLAAKAQELEDAQRSEAEKLAQRLNDAEARAQQAELELLKAQVAAERGLSASQAKRLSGSTREEIEADADELLEAFKPADEPERPGDTRPREKLRPATVRDEPEPEDPLLATLKSKVGAS